MQVALKIWRYDSSTGDRALKEYEIDAPEEATLLDCLDIVKDKVDGTLAYRKSCRMMICGSCGMRMDGAAVLACKVRMYDIAQAGEVPTISAMGNLPIVKDLVVDMDPFWQKFKAMKPYLQPGYDVPEDGKEYRISQERMNVVHKEALCINCGCCVSECNAMESDPEFLGPQALAKGMRFVGDPRDGAKVERLEEYSGAARHLGVHALLLLQRALPEGRRSARGDREARRRGDQGRHRPRHGREARQVVHPLDGDDGLAARDRARAEDAGHRLERQADEVRDEADRAQQGRARLPAARRGGRRTRRGRCTSCHARQDRRALGQVQGEHALAKLEHGYEPGRDPYGPGSFPRPFLPGERRRRRGS